MPRFLYERKQSISGSCWTRASPSSAAWVSNPDRPALQNLTRRSQRRWIEATSGGIYCDVLQSEIFRTLWFDGVLRSRCLRYWMGCAMNLTGLGWQRQSKPFQPFQWHLLGTAKFHRILQQMTLTMPRKTALGPRSQGRRRLLWWCNRGFRGTASSRGKHKDMESWRCVFEACFDLCQRGFEELGWQCKSRRKVQSLLVSSCLSIYCIIMYHILCQL